MKQNRIKKRRIAPVTWICGIIGGLLTAYPGMMALVALIPGRAAEKLIFPMMLLPLVWSGTAVWIFHSPDTGSALRKTLTAIFAAAIAAGAAETWRLLLN